MRPSSPWQRRDASPFAPFDGSVPVHTGGMDPQPVTTTAPELAGRPITRQSWRDLTFVHWRVAPEVVAPLLPAGTRPDVHDGSS